MAELPKINVQRELRALQAPNEPEFLAALREYRMKPLRLLTVINRAYVAQDRLAKHARGAADA